MDFEAFPKIPRLKRQIVITEKIDGTNAQIGVTEDGRIFAGCRTRWVTPGKSTDNYGFAAWVGENADELVKLGPGRHFGEWYGAGIQRRYGLEEKRFALFNTQRWGAHNPNTPACCSAVPLMYNGDYLGDVVEQAVRRLQTEGSIAVPGFMQPEGVVVYMVSAHQNFKVLCTNDHISKTEAEKLAA